MPLISHTLTSDIETVDLETGELLLPHLVRLAEARPCDGGHTAYHVRIQGDKHFLLIPMTQLESAINVITKTHIENAVIRIQDKGH
jgi:hypothetical protein